MREFIDVMAAAMMRFDGVPEMMQGIALPKYIAQAEYVLEALYAHKANLDAQGKRGRHA